MIIVAVCGFALACLVFWQLRRRGENVAVLVLGDLGRSPRMQNQALSLAKNGYRVDLIGSRGAELFRDVLEHQGITIHYIPNSTLFNTQNKLLFTVFGPLKALVQITHVFFALFSISRPRTLVVQVVDY